MTIQTAVLCDGDCDAVFAPDGRVPRGALARTAHEAGWASIHQNGQWRNYCPDHAN